MGGIIELGSLMGGSMPDIEILDVSESDIKKLKIGQYVEIKICGWVGKLSVPPDGDGNPSLGIKVDTREVRITGTNQEEGIRALADDTDDDSEDYVQEEKKA